MLAKLFIRIAFVLCWIGIIGAFIGLSLVKLPTGRRSINVGAWIGMFDAQLLAQFEKETGIRVNVSYYESNEELLLKLEKSANHGYDLIVPSDYAVHYLRSKGMLKKLDKKKLAFYEQLNPLLLGYYFDEQNDYSVPFEWAVFGLGINQDCFKDSVFPRTWGSVFDLRLSDAHKIIMTNDPLVAIPLASLYLYGSPQKLSKERLGAVKELLTSQRSFVAVYSDFRANYYLASRNGCIAVASSSYIMKSMRKHKHIDFIIPDAGSIMTIENFAITQTSKKDDMVYAFMNFMMKPESVAHSYEQIGFFPPTLDVLDRLEIPTMLHSLLALSKLEFEKFHLVRYDRLSKILNAHELQDAWVQIKA